MVTAFQLHMAKWRDGCGADICGRAKQVVHARGTLPCEVLFVGEAPGPSENVIGLPFKGPAGHLLDRIVARAFRDFPTATWAFVNLVGCIPLDDDANKFHEPDEESVRACQPRLVELVGIASPKLIVCVGKLAERWLKPGGYAHTAKLDRMIYFEHIDHPAFILRSPIAKQGLMVQRATVRLTEAYERFVLGR